MAAMFIMASWLLFYSNPASPVQYTQQSDRYCKQLDIPAFATAPSTLYDIPQVDNNIEATAWEIYDATWSTPHGVQHIIKNTTTFGTFNIHAQLCIPKFSKKKDILQIAILGVHYDSRYWDSEYQPEK